MAPLQKDLYIKFLRQKSSLIFNGQAEALSCITTLKKICNHPSLAFGDVGSEDFKEGKPKELDLTTFQPEYSGKLLVLDNLLNGIRKTTKDKVVLVSNSTKISF
jgi:DNA repair and recombination RAD54-like protein